MANLHKAYIIKKKYFKKYDWKYSYFINFPDKWEINFFFLHNQTYFHLSLECQINNVYHYRVDTVRKYIIVTHRIIN